MVLDFAAVLQRVGILIDGILVGAVRAVVMEAANLVVGVSIRVCCLMQNVQFRLIICSLQNISSVWKELS